MNMPAQLFKNFTRAHLYLFIVLYMVFAALAYLAVSGNPDHWAKTSAVCAFTGPFTGAIARTGVFFEGYNPCCWRFSLMVFPISCLFLAVGIMFQVIPLPFRRIGHAVRLTMWCLGLLGWFGWAQVSFLHALN